MTRVIFQAAFQFVLLVMALSLNASDEIPGGPQRQPIALVGGTVHPISGPPIESGTICFDQGKIVGIGVDIPLPKGAKRIDASGKHIYPGMFESHSQLGLVEISAVRATRDFREAGYFNANVKSWVSVNPDTESIPVTRSNGVLLALTAPAGSGISGKSAIIQLDGWTFEEMTLKTDAAMHLQMPRIEAVINVNDDDKSSPDTKKVDGLARLREIFMQSRAYRKGRDSADADQQFDIRYEAMLPVLDKQIPLMVAANDLASIQTAVAFAVEQDVKLIVLGGYDAPLCADLLRKHEVPVVISSTLRLPLRRSDDYDSSYTLPERLRQAQVKFCISCSDQSESWNVRNLPYHAATAAAYGLPRDEALKAITLYPAEIFGVDDRVGSLDSGKDATLIVTDGDPLETATHVERAFIQGRVVDLSDRHKRLYQKYREKYRQIESD